MSCAYSDGSHFTVFAARIHHLLCSVHMHATADVGLFITNHLVDLGEEL